MLRKNFAVRITVFLTVMLVLAQQALASAIPYSVYINGDLNPNSNLITQENLLNVRVYDSAGEEHTVKVGSVIATEIDPGEYLVDNYPLKVGANSITVVADTYKNTYNITYIDQALPDTSYYLPAIPGSGTITAINKTITLKFPKNNYIVEDSGVPEIVDDQGITIAVASFDAGDSPTIYHQAVSPVYMITPDSSELSSDDEREDAALLYAGELTLKYDPNVSSAAADNLTVVYIPYKDPDYDSYENEFDHYWSDTWSSRDCIVLGGRVDTSARTITVPFSKTGFGSYAVFNVNREFTDLLDSNSNLIWARNYVIPLWAKGVMEKTGSGEAFDDIPSSFITREEFTATIVKAMGIPVENGLQNPFEDVDDINLDVNQYDDYILTASKNGIINGFPETNGTYFHPGWNLTREQAATIIARVANLKVSDSETAIAAAMEKAFNDYDPDNQSNFSDWATPQMFRAGASSALPP